MARRDHQDDTPAEKSKRLWSQFLGHQTGTTAIEYALISGLIGVAIVVTMSAIGSVISNEFFALVTAAFKDI